MPGHWCIVDFCRHRGTHHFPTDKNRRAQWIQAINQLKPGKTVRKDSRICSAHFKPTDFRRTPLSLLNSDAVPKMLKKTAIPSQFPWKTACPRSPMTSQDQDSQTFTFTEVMNTYARNRPLTFVEEQPYLNTLTSDLNEDPLHWSNDDTNSDFDDSSQIYDNKENVEMEFEIAEELEIPTYENLACQERLSGNTIGNDKSVDKSIQTNDVQILDCNVHAFSIHHYRNNDKAIHFHTGLENFNKVMLVFNTLGQSANELNYFYGQPPHNLDAFEMFFITLLILRRHKTFEEIAMTYQTTIKQIYNIFITWIRFMSLQWKNLDLWIDKESIKAYMPLDFYDKFPSTRVVLDATEFPIKKPTLPFAQQVTFSSYKNRNTVKVLIGITPSGLISYVSPCYGGSASDRQIIERSTILSKFDYNDEIMVDKGLNVQDIFIPFGVKVNMPSFFKKGNQIGSQTLSSNRKVASKRVHVERVIGLLKTYKILCEPMNQTEILLSSDIVFICAILVNFRSSIISKNA